MTTERFTPAAPEFGEESQDFGEEVSWDRDFRHLECDIATMTPKGSLKRRRVRR